MRNDPASCAECGVEKSRGEHYESCSFAALREVRELIAAAYSEGFNDAWVLTRGLYADDDLVREQFLKSLAAEGFPTPPEAEHE